MLQTLLVKNIALIGEAEITFGSGLNILTGETGAGKSLLMDALHLGLGGKASADIIRNGEEFAGVTLTFLIEDEEIRREIEAMDIELPDDFTLILSRKLYTNRSVYKANGEPVTQKQMAQIGSLLIDIYAQNEYLYLTKTKNQLEMLDIFCGEEAAVIKKQVACAYHNWKDSQKKLDAMNTDSSVRERELALAKFEADEIDEAQIKIGEDAALESAFKRMQNAEKITQSIAKAQSLMSEDGGGASYNTGRALSELNGVASLDESIEELLSQLRDIEDLTQAFCRELSAYEENTVFEPKELDVCLARLDLINRLKHKFGNDIADIFAHRNECLQIIENAESFESNYAALASECSSYKAALDNHCTRLTKLRAYRSKEFARLMDEALSELQFDKAGFEIKLSPLEEPGLNGADFAEFMFCANMGEKFMPLAQSASGGELSRVMLAAKTLLTDEGYTYVFDEIDAGISGKTAWQVSKRLAKLADKNQIICITHLPQIAAMADHHFLIEKRAEGQFTKTFVNRLTAEGMIEELARMVGGGVYHEAAMENARELKRQAKQAHYGE